MPQVAKARTQETCPFCRNTVTPNSRICTACDAVKRRDQVSLMIALVLWIVWFLFGFMMFFWGMVGGDYFAMTIGLVLMAAIGIPALRLSRRSRRIMWLRRA